MRKIIPLIIIIFTLVQLVFSQGSTEKKQENWKWYLLEDFESCANWEIVNSIFTKSTWKNNCPLLSRINGTAKEAASDKNQYCLGIKFPMEDWGDTRRFVIPRHQIVLPGLCKKISFWLNGRNNNIAMTVMFMDENNLIHTFKTKPALINFFGWQKVEVDNLDRKIDQYSPESRYKKPIKIIAFVFENPLQYFFNKDIYVYIDQLEAYCRDDVPPSYDGDQIPDIW